MQKLVKEWEDWAAGAEKDCLATATKYPNLRFNQQKQESSEEKPVKKKKLKKEKK